MGNFYGHLHSREAMTDAQAVAAAAGRRSRRGRHRDRRRRASASPTRAMAASICRTPSPACPTRSARPSSSIRRSGTARPAATMCSRPIRWCRRPAARCIAPTRSRRSRAMIGLAAAATERRRRANTTRRSTTARCKSLRRRAEPTAHKPWPIKTAPFYAMPICAAITNTMGGIVVDGERARARHRAASRSPACTPPVPRSAASMAARIPVISAD